MYSSGVSPALVISSSISCVRAAQKSATRHHSGHPAEIKPDKSDPYDKGLYRERNWIERVFGHLKINRAVATRYDQLAETFLGMLQMDFVHIEFPMETARQDRLREIAD